MEIVLGVMVILLLVINHNQNQTIKAQGRHLAAHDKSIDSFNDAINSHSRALEALTRTVAALGTTNLPPEFNNDCILCSHPAGRHAFTPFGCGVPGCSCPEYMPPNPVIKED